MHIDPDRRRWLPPNSRAQSVVQPARPGRRLRCAPGTSPDPSAAVRPGTGVPAKGPIVVPGLGELEVPPACIASALRTPRYIASAPRTLSSWANRRRASWACSRLSAKRPVAWASAASVRATCQRAMGDPAATAQRRSIGNVATASVIRPNSTRASMRHNGSHSATLGRPTDRAASPNRAASARRSPRARVPGAPSDGL